MRPKIIMHTQISLDGCVNGFDNPDAYYMVASKLNTDMILFGSETMITAFEEYPPETKETFVKPPHDPEDTRAMCIVPDSRGRLRNLHVFRNSEYIRDFIVLVSESTPESYLNYLSERNYDYIMAGNDYVDYRKAFEILYEKYHCKSIRTDSGGVLTNVLLQQGLIDEISLVIAPCLVGKHDSRLFRTLSLPEKIDLEFISSEIVDTHYLSLIYKVRKG